MRVTELKLTARLETGELVEITSPAGAVSDLEVSAYEDYEIQSLAQFSDYSLETPRFAINANQHGFSHPLIVRVIRDAPR